MSFLHQNTLEWESKSFGDSDFKTKTFSFVQMKLRDGLGGKRSPYDDWRTVRCIGFDADKKQIESAVAETEKCYNYELYHGRPKHQFRAVSVTIGASVVAKWHPEAKQLK